VWALAGLLLGAFFAPLLMKSAGLADSPYQDTLDVGVAVLAGLLVQLVSWSLFVPVVFVVDSALKSTSRNTRRGLTFLIIAFLVPWPIGGVVYALYRYFTWVGPGQAHVTVAFVGALLVKSLLIPLVKAIVTGAALKWFLKVLSDNKATLPRG
jgi:hypothetical protein